jgi:hypothetical protein
MSDTPYYVPDYRYDRLPADQAPPCEPMTWKCGHVARFASPDRRKHVERRICPICLHPRQEGQAEQRQKEEARP